MLFRIFIRGIRWLLEVQNFQSGFAGKEGRNHFAGLLKNEISAILRGCSDAKITQPYIPICSANQMITYLISRGLSDAQIQKLSGREDWKSVSILTLDAVEQAYQKAVQSVSILNDTQQCQKSQSYESFGTFVGI
jgi:hypothetical protein